MRVRLLFAGLTAALILMCVPALASAQGFHKKTLHFIVHVGPGKRTECKIIGDLYRPDSATAAHRAPAILTTNGFAGSKDSQAGFAKEFAAQGYVVLAYSGLGFGYSSCRITLDSTTYDGEAASQLVTFLGGGSKAVGGTKVNYVELNKRAANGRHYAHDPEVGMIGGSYGGALQFAAAAVDPRIDTIVPMITWNNLAYSLAPNNATLARGSVSYSTPGITKLDWLNIFWLLGETGPSVAPHGGASSCPNFSQPECAADSNLTTDGYPNTDTLNLVKDASVADYMSHVRIPTLLMQGEDDTLFTLHEAVATYNALRKQHTPVKMVWQSWGHSDLTPQPGELGGTVSGEMSGLTPSGKLTLEGKMIEQWMNHYLKHTGPKPALNFSFYKPWVSYKGDDAAAAYSSAPKYPIATNTSMYLSGAGALVTSQGSQSVGEATFTTPTTSAPESMSDNPGSAQPTPSDPSGTYAEYESAPLAKTLNVVGIPTLTVTATAPSDQLSLLGPSGTLGLYFKLEDISQSDAVTLPDGLVAAARFADNGTPVTVSLPGIVHQFKAGDRIALVIAGSDSSYFLADPDVEVTVNVGGGAGGVLTLPVAESGSYGPVKLTK